MIDLNVTPTTGEFPSLLKLSHVRLRLKKDNLDKVTLKNYRPVVGVTFKSIIQGATTLLRVTNDILRTIDRRQDVVLVLLDLSATFDTIDHTILVERLES